MQKRLPPASSLFGIVEGTIQLSVRRGGGVLLPFVPFGAGYWLGDVAMLSGEPGLVSIESTSDVTAAHIPAQNADLKIARRLMILTEFAKLDGNWKSAARGYSRSTRPPTTTSFHARDGGSTCRLTGGTFRAERTFRPPLDSSTTTSRSGTETRWRCALPSAGLPKARLTLWNAR